MVKQIEFPTAVFISHLVYGKKGVEVENKQWLIKAEGEFFPPLLQGEKSHRTLDLTILKLKVLR